jgi:Flp pilus assembly pilin Flp
MFEQIFRRKNMILGRLKNKKGQGMTEYILIIAVVVLIGFAIFSAFGERLKGILGKITDQLEQHAEGK